MTSTPCLRVFACRYVHACLARVCVVRVHAVAADCHTRI